MTDWKIKGNITIITNNETYWEYVFFPQTRKSHKISEELIRLISFDVSLNICEFALIYLKYAEIFIGNNIFFLRILSDFHPYDYIFA